MLSRLWQNRHSGDKRHKRGFLMVDIIVGIFIISVALVALGAAYRQSTLAMVKIRNRAEALAVAQQKMEYLKRYDGTPLSVAIPSSEFNAATVTGPAGIAQFTVQAQQVTVTSVSSLTNIVPIQVTVTWNEIQGNSSSGQQSIRIMEYIYRQ